MLKPLRVPVQYVSKFTENSMDGEKLERVYHKIKSGKASAATVHSTGAGTHGEPLCTVHAHRSRRQHAVIMTIVPQPLNSSDQLVRLRPVCPAAANGLEETEDGDLVDEEAYEEEEEPPPESSKRQRAEDWEGGRSTPPAW